MFNFILMLNIILMKNNKWKIYNQDLKQKYYYKLS